MPTEKPIATKCTAPKIKFLKLWQDHKKLFEKNTNKKKPSEKGFFGLYRKSAGIEPAFKLLDKVLADVPMPISDQTIFRNFSSPYQIAFQMKWNADRQLEWVSNFDKAVTSFTKNCDAYQKLLDKSTNDDEYKLFADDVRELKKALKVLVRKATACSAMALTHHKTLTDACNLLDGTNKHVTAIAAEVKVFNVMLKAHGIKPLLDEKSATLKKDIAAALESLNRAYDDNKANKAAASRIRDPKNLRDTKKSAERLIDAVHEASRSLEEPARQISESFSNMMETFDAE